MFPYDRSRAADKLRGALALARAFLLLEDDDAVDWEVDVQPDARAEPPGVNMQAEPLPEPVEAAVQPHARTEHPHRAPLRGRARHRTRRPGQLPPPIQPCLCPLPDRTVAACPPAGAARAASGASTRSTPHHGRCGGRDPRASA